AVDFTNRGSKRASPLRSNGGSSVTSVRTPNFLVIGAAKSGTTALCDDLRAHPDICFSLPKETFFFNREDCWNRGMDWYERCFAHHSGEAAIGDGSTEYSLRGVFPEAAGRIHRTLGTPRVVYVVREPLSRIESMWMELRSQGLEQQAFIDAVQRSLWYVDGSRYAHQIAAFDAFLPREHILLLTHDAYVEAPAETLARICRFLDVDPSFAFPRAGEFRYASTGKREDTGLGNLVRRRLPGFRSVQARSPEWLTALAKRTLKRPIDGRPVWTTATRRSVWDAVEGDVRSILERAHESDRFDAWRKRAFDRPVVDP
ncbi:MAG: sulfotransferase, partial [Planctomycetota bacterium]